MEPSPQRRAVAALALALTGLTWLVQAPILLVGVAALGAWLVAWQWAFTSAVGDVTERIAVGQTVDRSRLRTDDVTTATIAARLPTTSRLTLSLESGVPVPATAHDGVPTISIAPGDTAGADARTIRWPVAGSHQFRAASLTAADQYLETTVPIGDQPTVTVEPRASEVIHVGTGGDRIGTAIGEHDGGRLGDGDEPAEPREYVPGDTADRIDWNATARLGTTYVREYDTATDRQTTLVVDHRSSLAVGPTAGTAFDHLRDVALSVAERAASDGDPTGLVTVDDAGITGHLDPGITDSRYQRVRRRLLDLEPTEPTRRGRRRPTGTAARRHLSALESNATDPFARQLRPFFADRATGTEDAAVGSLADAVRATAPRRRDGSLIAIFTDDSRPADVRATVAQATGASAEVLVFLAPALLYERDSATPLTAAFDRYVEFEEFRRELTALEGVTAFEVGPHERLSSLLAASESRGGVA